MKNMELSTDFYINEFAQYMNWDNDKIKDYIFINNFPCLSDEENNLVKILLTVSPHLLNGFSAPRNININIHVYCIKGNCVDAFCFQTNNHYYIAIYSEVFKKILGQSKNLSNSIVNNSETASIFKLEGDSLIARLVLCTFQMILMHEYMHIVLGHCDLICKHCKFMWEIGNSDEYKHMKQFPLSLSEQRAMEMLADECSAMNEGIKLLQNCDSIEKIKENLLIFYLGVATFFSLFQIDCINGTHPCFEFRFNSMAIMIDDILLKNINVENPEECVEEIDTVIDDLINIIKNFPNILNMNLLSYLLTNDFETEYFLLYNAASELLKRTNQYAKYKLNDLTPLNKTDFDNYEIQKNIFCNDIINSLNGGNNNG